MENTPLTPLLRIQNSKNPTQVVELNWDDEEKMFVTRGLRDLFGAREIKISSGDLLPHLEEYAHVIGSILEAMSTAEDLHLPFGYKSPFRLGGHEYELVEEGEYTVLRPPIVQEEKNSP